jgi:hypothetical protein
MDLMGAMTPHTAIFPRALALHVAVVATTATQAAGKVLLQACIISEQEAAAVARDPSHKRGAT